MNEYFVLEFEDTKHIFEANHIDDARLMAFCWAKDHCLETGQVVYVRPATPEELVDTTVVDLREV